MCLCGCTGTSPELMGRDNGNDLISLFIVVTGVNGIEVHTLAINNSLFHACMICAFSLSFLLTQYNFLWKSSFSAVVATWLYG